MGESHGARKLNILPCSQLDWSLFLDMGESHGAKKLYIVLQSVRLVPLMDVGEPHGTRKLNILF